MSRWSVSPCDEGIILSAKAESPCGARRGRWVLLAAILGSSMAFIDGTVVNVALAALRRDLGADVIQLQWIVEAYALVLAALLLVGGAMGDRYGRRRVFAIGVALFALASMGCGLAPTAGWLIAARAAQGLGAALLVPGSLAIIAASFRNEDRGRAIGTWSAFSAISAGLGLLLGGALIDWVHWRLIFWLNVPVAAATLWVAFAQVPESRDPDARAGPLDWPGAIAATIGLAGLTYGLITAGEAGWWAARVWVGLGVGVAALIGWIVIEMRVARPMMPLSLFRNPTFAGANLLTLLLYGALGGVMFFLPLNLIEVHGYSATAAGAATLPLVAILFLLSRWSGGLVNRIGPRPPLVIGPIVAAVGFALLARPGIDGGYWAQWFPPIAVIGLGMAICVAPLTTAVMSSAPHDKTGVASGINNTMSRTAAVLAIAVFGPVMVGVFAGDLDTSLQTLGVEPEARRAMLEHPQSLAGIALPDTLPEVQREDVELAVNQAFVAGFRTVAWVTAALALVSGVVAGLTLRRKDLIPDSSR